MIVACVVSGGQTGADRAALDTAIALGLPYGGWCPRGGWAEDLEDRPGLLSSYPLLREAPDRDPRVRTEWNVRDSHATLVLHVSEPLTSLGAQLTAMLARELGRPCLVTRADDAGSVTSWLDSFDRDASGTESAAEALALNVAGPRESEDPGLYAVARKTLETVLRQSGRVG